MLNKANTAFVVCLVWGAGRMWHKHICRSGRHRGGVLWGGDVHTMSCGGEMSTLSTKRRCPQTAGFRCVLPHTAQEIQGNMRKYKEMHRNAKQGIKE